MYSMNAVPPFILVTDYIYLRRSDIDGSNSRILLTYYYNYGLDYDYRFNINIIITKCVLHVFFNALPFRRDYLFWSDRPRDRIIRSRLNGTGATIIASGDMSCVCKLKRTPTLIAFANISSYIFSSIIVLFNPLTINSAICALCSIHTSLNFLKSLTLNNAPMFCTRAPVM